MSTKIIRGSFTATEFNDMVRNSIGHKAPNMAGKLRPVTEQEWNEYEWLDTFEKVDGAPIVIRGLKRTRPPEDGYHYSEVTTYADTERKWARVLTPED